MNSRRPPPTGAPPPYALVSRMYNRSLRPIVFIITIINAIWALFSSINSFQDIKLDHSSNEPKLAPLSTALAVMYLTVFVIEVFGLISTYMQRLALVRLFAYSTVVAALLIIGAGFIRTIVHFTLKNDLISECTLAATNQTVSFTTGIWGSSSDQQLNQTEALQWCQGAWSHDSFSEIVTLIVAIIVSVLFSYITFAYYRQVLDPSSPTNAMRAPSNQARMGAYPSAYAPPYNGYVPSLGYNYPSSYAPPPRDERFAPPHDNDDDKLPGYGVGVGGDGKIGALDHDGKGDPFSDFDGPSARVRSGEEDLAERPWRG